MAADVSLVKLNKALDEGVKQCSLKQGKQQCWILDYGTYPFVTSSSC